MADTGVTGPDTVIEGEDGFAAAFADDADLATFERLGDPYAITETYRKPYACCRHVHGPIDAALRAREQLDPGAVDAVLVETYPTAARHDATDVDTRLDAQMSIPYGVAAALLDGRPDLAAFNPGGAPNELFALDERASVKATEQMAARYPDERPSRTVVRGGGREVVHDIPYPTGAAEAPTSLATLREKYDSLTGSVPDEVADRAFDAALDLPAASGSGPFFDLVAVAGSPG